MGFRYEPRIAVIEFEEPFEGLQIRAALDLPAVRQLRVIKQLQKLQAITAEGDEEQAEAALREAMGLFVEVTDGWNWEDSDGNPVPLTVETLLNVIPGNLAFMLTNRWAETVRGVPGPLDETSSSGGTSQENPTQTPGSQSESPSS